MNGDTFVKYIARIRKLLYTQNRAKKDAQLEANLSAEEMLASLLF